MNYTLDTSTLLHLLRDSSLTVSIFNKIREYDHPLLIISIVSKAELLSIALQNKWGEKKLKKLNRLLNDFLVVPIDSEGIAQRYAEIDAFSQGKFEIKEKYTPFSSKNMGKNDIWIASTASLTDSTLLTTDKDFEHLNGIFLKVILFND